MRRERLPEALARMRRDATLTGRSQTTVFANLAGALKRLRAMPARGYAAAALTAALVGIVVNALTLQRERHPAPFFSHASAVAPSPSPAPLAAQTAAIPAPPARPARPAELGGESAAAARVDAIGDMLRADQDREAQRQLTAAQGALIRLGYTLKADGEPSAATTTALREFERAHGLPPSNAITPRLLKTLTTAADATGR